MSLILALAGLVGAQSTPEPWLVAASTRAYFRDAPVAGSPPRTAYVMPGDMLVAEASTGAFTSVTFVSTGGTRTRGWIETARLRRVPAAPPSVKGWSGMWLFDAANIEIHPGKAPGTLRVKGIALWGTHDPWRVKNGGINTGELDGTVTAKGDRADYSDGAGEYDCRAELRLLGPYLLVEDNGNCGGVNVTFSGIYRK
jgi:hypothetical protein